MKLIPAVLKEQALKKEIEATRCGDGLAIWWLGQSGFLIKSRVGTVLFDPYLSDSLTQKYRDTDKPHVRMTELAISPDQLENIDLVTSTHNHTDHLDAETLLPLIAANPDIAFVIPEANRDFVSERLGCDLNWPLGMSDGDSRHIGKMHVHAVPAAHNAIDRDSLGRCHYLGYIVRLGEITIYHSGDTMLYPAMADLLKPMAIDLAILPINGYRTERRVSGNLFGDEAAELAKQIGARMVLPCHYDMFTFNTESPELFASTCRSIEQPYRVLRCAERLLFE